MTSEEIKRDMQAAANLATQAGASGDVTTTQTAMLSIALLEIAYQLAVANENAACVCGHMPNEHKPSGACGKCECAILRPRR